MASQEGSVVLLFLFFFVLILLTPKEPPKTSVQKVEQLTDLTAKKSIIRLDAKTLQDYITPQRDFSFIVMFTFMSDKRDCVPCDDMYDEYMRVADSFRFSSAYNKKIFFAVVDYDDEYNYRIFQELHIKTVPAIMHFPAKGNLYQVESMDYTKDGRYAEDIVRWIESRTGVQIPLNRPPENSIVPLVFIILILVAVFKFPKLTDRVLTGLISVLVIGIKIIAWQVLAVIVIVIKSTVFFIRSLIRI